MSTTHTSVDDAYDLATLIRPKPFDYFGALAADDVARHFAHRLTDRSGSRLAHRAIDGSAAWARVAALPWDSGQLGVPCGQLELRTGGPNPPVRERLAEAVAVARERGFQFLTARARAEDTVSNGALEELGFRLVNSEITLVHDGRQLADHDGHHEVEVVRNRRVPELEALGDIFKLSRFHADPRISSETANRLWRSSIAGCCTGWAEVVYVLRDAGRAIAFVACRDDDVAGAVFGRPVRSFFLVGVDPAFRGRGAGRAIVQAALRASAARTDLIEVETQAANTAARRLYASCGFALAASKSIYHLWLD